jgi:uncharacterized protein
MNVMKRQAILAAICAALAFGVMTPGPAIAQFSESYNFLKAVRERDGQKVNDFTSKPGSIIVDTRDSSTGETALHIVTKRRDLTWLSFLLGKGAKPDVLDRDGNSSLMLASQIGFVEGASLLISQRASVDLPNKSGETPLIRAVQNRDSVMTRVLLAAGANADKKDRVAGMSARDYATRDTRAGAILKLINEAKVVKPAAGPKL